MKPTKYTQNAQQAILAAQSLARELHHQVIEPAHLLLALLNQPEGTVPALVTQIAGSPQVLVQDLQQELSARPKVYADTIPEPGLSRTTQDALDAAERYAKGMGDDYTSTEHILLGLTDTPEGKRLAQFGLTKDAILKSFLNILCCQSVTS